MFERVGRLLVGVFAFGENPEVRVCDSIFSDNDMIGIVVNSAYEKIGINQHIFPVMLTCR
jgi:hypothetical protein